jgi:hypothetical protein
MFVITWEKYDLERVAKVVGRLLANNAIGSFLTRGLTSGGAMNDKEPSLSIVVFVDIVEVAGNNEGRCMPEREETMDDRRERAGIAVKWEPFDWEDAVAVAWLFDCWSTCASRGGKPWAVKVLGEETDDW